MHAFGRERGRLEFVSIRDLSFLGDAWMLSRTLAAYASQSRSIITEQNSVLTCDKTRHSRQRRDCAGPCGSD